MKVDFTKKEVEHLKSHLLTGCEICLGVLDKIGGNNNNSKEIREDTEEGEE